MPYTAFYARKSYIQENKDIVNSFNKAINKGLEYVETHSNKEVAEVILKQFPDSSLNDIELIVKRYRDADSWYTTTYITEEGFDRVQDIMDNSGKLEKVAPYDKLVNNEYNKK